MHENKKLVILHNEIKNTEIPLFVNEHVDLDGEHIKYSKWIDRISHDENISFDNNGFNYWLYKKCNAVEATAKDLEDISTAEHFFEDQSNGFTENEALNLNLF